MISNLGASVELMTPAQSCALAAQQHIERATDDLVASLPNAEQLSADERRGIIARYTAILEGNFIYWMTATFLSVRSAEAHSIIEDNLREEVRDNHPGMLRRFAVAAHGTSTDADRLAVERNLQDVRAFVARLSTLQIVLMMAFFEGFIARFMPFLADLATRQGSKELEYTDVHGVVDIGHTQGLFNAFAAEMALASSPQPWPELLDGVTVLSRLLKSVIGPSTALQQQQQ